MLRLPGIFLLGQVTADDKRVKVTVNGNRLIHRRSNMKVKILTVVILTLVGTSGVNAKDKISASLRPLYAKFGDLERFLKTDVVKDQESKPAELIHIKRPTSRHRWYGMPDWLSAVASIELVHAIKQSAPRFCG